MGTILGTNGADRLSGTASADILRLLAGDDSLFGGNGIDRLAAGDGIDTAFGGNASDTVWGDAGADRLFGGSGNDRLEGGGDGDRVFGGAGNDRLTGGAAGDYLSGGAGNDALRGDAGDDRLNGGDGSDTASYAGARGSVTVDLASGRAEGAAGSDRLLAIEGVVGSAFADTLSGGLGANLLAGGEESDSLRGAAGDDVLAGGGGNDRLNGGAGIDLADYATARGAVEVDLVAGRASGADGYDRLVAIEGAVGSAFADTLAGDDAANTFQGGAGDDVINGGAGLDVAVFTGAATDFAIDRSGGAVVVTDRNLADGDDGTDRLQGVEWARFDDGQLWLGTDGQLLQPLPPSSLGDLGAQGFTIFGSNAGDRSGSSVSSAGDVNGDGLDDLIVGAWAAGPRNAYDNSAGASYVLFGSASSFATSLDLATLDGSNGFVIAGALAGDLNGFSVSGAGDVNGDGIADVIVGSPGALYSVYSEENSGFTFYYGGSRGEAYVIYGNPDGPGEGLDTGNLPPEEGFRIAGDGVFDAAGTSVSSAGDVNGDGLADILVGAPFASSYSGESYILFGRRGHDRLAVELGELREADGFRVFNTQGNGSMLGHSLRCAGDVNGDGLSDVVIGAYYGNGETVVLYGRPGATRIDINTAQLSTRDGFRILAASGGDGSGFSVSGAGDVNGDGYADVLVGAYRADGEDGSRADAGQTYLIFGTGRESRGDISLATLAPADGYCIFGAAAGDRSGSSVASAGDVNGDGIDDLIVGASRGDLGSDATADAGAAYVIFGHVGAARENIDLANLAGRDGFRLAGAGGGDFSGGSVASAGDLNGDGFDDLIIGAPLADSTGNERTDAGESYIVYGGDFSSAVTTLGSLLSETLIGTSTRDVTVAAQGNDRILGLAGDDVLKGGAGNDVLKGGVGNDLLEGDSGRDLFVLAPGDGDDRVRDFENGRDRIDLRAFDGLAFADLAISTGTASGGPGTVVAIDATTSLRLLGIPAGYLDPGDVLFG